MSTNTASINEQSTVTVGKVRSLISSKIGELGLSPDTLDPDTISITKKVKLNNGLQLPTNAIANALLTSDADGNATWQAPSDLVDLDVFSGTSIHPLVVTSSTSAGMSQCGMVPSLLHYIPNTQKLICGNKVNQIGAVETHVLEANFISVPGIQPLSYSFLPVNAVLGVLNLSVVDIFPGTVGRVFNFEGGEYFMFQLELYGTFPSSPSSGAFTLQINGTNIFSLQAGGYGSRINTNQNQSFSSYYFNASQLNTIRTVSPVSTFPIVQISLDGVFYTSAPGNISFKIGYSDNSAQSFTMLANSYMTFKRFNSNSHGNFTV
jgi:hypothetical protein